MKGCDQGWAAHDWDCGWGRPLGSGPVGSDQSGPAGSRSGRAKGCDRGSVHGWDCGWGWVPHDSGCDPENGLDCGQDRPLGSDHVGGNQSGTAGSRNGRAMDCDRG